MDYVSSRFCIYTYISLEKFDDEKLTEEFNNDFNLRKKYETKYLLKRKKKKKRFVRYFFGSHLKNFHRNTFNSAGRGTVLTTFR